MQGKKSAFSWKEGSVTQCRVLKSESKGETLAMPLGFPSDTPFTQAVATREGPGGGAALFVPRFPPVPRTAGSV